MATLISHYYSDRDRRRVLRCDGRCYGAKKPVCRCICGGRFHGKGFADAQRELTVGVYGELLAEAGRKGAELRVPAAMVPSKEEA